MQVVNPLSTGPVLVVAAHPDDEVLGCGGTLARLAASGIETHVLFMTDGVSSRPGANDLAARREAAASAAEIIGLNPPTFNDFPDNALDTVPLIEVVRIVEAAIERIAPKTVFTHHHGDLNVDHQVAHRAVITACRPQPGRDVKSILSFSVRSSSEWCVSEPGSYFRPNLFVDIDSTLERKLEALRAYAMEMRKPPHTRSLEAVESEARVLGHTAGLPAAEGFGVVRIIT